MVITTGEFTKDARAFASENIGISLIDREKLKVYTQEYF